MVYNKGQIAQEYDNSSLSFHEHEKVKWGSHQKMENRFLNAISQINFHPIRTWLDVGSGTGYFQALVMKKFPKIEAYGIDLSEQLIQYAASRPETASVTYVNKNYLEYSGKKFDLITCIGVLQKTNFTPADFFRHTATLCNTSATVYIDTKNINWNKFKTPGFKPEAEIDWFAPSELIHIANEHNFLIEIVRGFIPESASVTEPDESHTFFMKIRYNG